MQGFAGGRLGTLLIERGSVTEDDIGRALSEQHGCDYIPWNVLGSVPVTVTVSSTIRAPLSFGDRARM